MTDTIVDPFASVVPEESETPEPVLTLSGESVPEAELGFSEPNKTFLFGIDASIIFGVLVGMVIQSFIHEQ